MKLRAGTLFTSTIMKNYNDYSRKFTEDDGFQLAFAVIDYQTDDLTDVAGRQLEEYLRVKLSWSNINFTEDEFEFIEIEHHPCSDSELGLDDSGDSKFSPMIDEGTLKELTDAKHLWRCFDHS